MPDYIFPVLFDGARITSGIGARSAPMAGASTNHRGIDIAADAGSPVVAPTDLRVTYAGTARGYGNVVYGVDNTGNEYRFAHLQSFGVERGDVLSQGGYLGAVGSTGNSTGNHLHFEVRDKAGNLLRDATQRVVSSGRRAAGGAISNALNMALKTNPVTAPFAIGADLFGVNPLSGGGGDCGLNPICHLQKWFEETAFVQRMALFIVAIVLIGGGIMFLGKGYAIQNVTKAIAK